MWFKKSRTPLEKALEQHEHLIEDWKKNYSNDGAIEEYIFIKGDFEIIFQEDLREHIINFKVLHPSKRYIKVCFRECSVFSTELEVEELIYSLEKLKGFNNKEKEEIAIYFNFLEKNNILSNDFKN